jgi:hypothetical protein
MLELAQLVPLKTGNVRAVYQHPREPPLLVKVIRREAYERRWARGRWWKRLPRALHYAGYVRELKEYIALQARAPDRHAPIARTVGIVETDLGLGLVSEKVVDASGALAPSLHAIFLQHGALPAWAADALENFREELLRDNVIVGDLHAGNIVHGSDSRGVPPRFILVDGFGEKNVIPFNSMSRGRNARHTAHQFRRLQRELDALRRGPDKRGLGAGG